MGAVFAADSAGDFVILHNPQSLSDGIYPHGSLVQGRDGYFYGTTQGDGNNSFGTIFKIDSSGNNFTTLHTFGINYDGSGPVGNLIQGTDGSFYGMTPNGGYVAGGPSNSGTIFKIEFCR